MKSNYKKLGDYIQQVKEKNKDLKVKKLQGISINKEFMPSVANVIGTDLSKYKIVKKGQFAFNPMHVGRDEVLPISLLQEDESIIASPAFVIFEILDTNELDPEYLMMWFRRKEFDRRAWFTTDDSIRGGFKWNDLCKIELPIPHIDTQKEIVKECNTLINRIDLNNKLIQKSEETAQSIYKQWFVDFEFPDENENPYRSSGGNMEYNEELDKDIPKGWKNGFINDVADLIDGDRGDNYPCRDEMFDDGYCLFLNAGNVTKKGFAFFEKSFISKEKDEILNKGKLSMYDVILTTRGTVGNLAYFGEHIEYKTIRINSGMIILRGKKHKEDSLYVYYLLKNSNMVTSIKKYLSGSAQPQLPIKDLIGIPIEIPESEVITSFTSLIFKIQNNIDILNKEIRISYKLLNILLSKMSKEDKIEI